MQNKKESFVFYESFYLAIKTLPEKEQLLLFKAISERALYGNEQKLSGVVDGMFRLILPQIEANEKRYLNSLKGGRPKKDCLKENETKPTVFKSETKNKPNDNENVDVYENENAYADDNVYENENENKNGNVLLSSDKAEETKKTKHKYGTYKNVFLSDEDIENLKEKFPYDYMQKIEKLSDGIELKGYKYKNHYLAILKWAEKETEKADKERSYAGYDIKAYEKMLAEQDWNK